MLTRAAFEDWLRRYEAAWENQDRHAIMAIFTPDGTYREKPFDTGMAGRDAIGAYWDQVETKQARIDFTFQVLAVEGDTGLAWWQSRFDWLPTGRRIELDGIFKCTFRDGLCSELQEWWHERDIGAIG